VTAGADLRLLDGRLVRQRRFALGISSRVLASALGVSQQVVYRLEHGMRQNDLDVTFLDTLAAAVGLSVRELLVDDGGGRVKETDPDGLDAADARHIGALLAAAADWVFVDEVADALGWTVARAALALAALEPSLSDVGQRLAWLGDREVRLAAWGDESGAVGRVSARAVSSWGITAQEAHLLYEAVHDSPTSSGRGRRGALLATRRLVSAGILVVDPLPQGRQDDKPRPSGATRHNLCLAELGLGEDPTEGRP